MIHKTLRTSPVLTCGQIKQSKVGFLKEKMFIVVCLSHGTGFLFQSCVMSQIPVPAGSGPWLWQLLGPLDVFVIKQKLASWVCLFLGLWIWGFVGGRTSLGQALGGPGWVGKGRRQELGVFVTQCHLVRLLLQGGCDGAAQTNPPSSSECAGNAPVPLLLLSLATAQHCVKLCSFHKWKSSSATKENHSVSPPNPLLSLQFPYMHRAAKSAPWASTSGFYPALTCASGSLHLSEEFI